VAAGDAGKAKACGYGFVLVVKDDVHLLRVLVGEQA